MFAEKVKKGELPALEKRLPAEPLVVMPYNEIGKYLGLPTQAYIGLSDAKLLDAQAGLETSNGAILASLAGINNISGPGMLDFESCTSLEKLVLDKKDIIVSRLL